MPDRADIHAPPDGNKRFMSCIAGTCLRTVCRRAERAIVALGKADTLNAQPRQYVNRLSDLLFVLARVLNHHAGGGDVLWQKGRERDV